MSDKYLYDKDGKFIGRVSEKPPNEQNGDPTILLYCFGGCALLPIVLFPGLAFSDSFGYTRAAFENSLDYKVNLGRGSPHWLYDGMKCPQTWVISIAFWVVVWYILTLNTRNKSSKQGARLTSNHVVANNNPLMAELKNEYLNADDIRKREISNLFQEMGWGKPQENISGTEISLMQKCNKVNPIKNKERLLEEYKIANADRKWEIYNIFKEQGWGKPY